MQKNLLPFYRDVLGMTVAVDTPEFVVLGANAAGPSVTLGTHSQVKGKNADPARHMVGPRGRRRSGGVCAAEGEGRGVRR